MSLDIFVLVSQIDRLQEGLIRHRSEPADDQLRDGLIKRLAFTYDLCHRMLRQFIRQGLLQGDWPVWHRYRDKRAKTNHAYHAGTAQAVAEAVPGFLAEAKYLRDQLRKRLP